MIDTAELKLANGNNLMMEICTTGLLYSPSASTRYSPRQKLLISPIEDWCGRWNDFRLHRSERAEHWYLLYFSSNFDPIIAVNTKTIQILE